MELKNLIFVVLIISVIAIAFGGFVSETNTNYNLDINTTYADTYSRLSAIENESSSVAGKVRGGEIDDATAFETLSVAGFSAVKLSFTSTGVIISLFSDMQRALHLPYWVVTIFITFLTVSIAYAVLSYIFRWRG